MNGDYFLELGNNKKVDFYILKGVVEAIVNNVGLRGYEIEPETTNLTFHPGRCAKVVYNNIYIGLLPIHTFAFAKTQKRKITS